MSDANRNAWWCRLLVSQLRACGVRHVVLCPGNRNVPLLFAFGASDISCTVHVDERGAAFHALGMAKRSGQPCAVCTTSGTAVANLHPAICEAAQAKVGLVAISADRPPELHDCEAPQTMPQVGIFGDHCQTTALPLPDDDAASMLNMISVAVRANQPAHINVPLAEPLPPIPDPSWRSPADPALASVNQPGLHAEPETSIHAALRPGMRGVIVAGPRSPLDPAAVHELVQTTGFPLLADAASGLRLRDMPKLITTADVIAGSELIAAEPELLIRLGPAPIARPTYEWCAAQACPVIRIDHEIVTRDFAQPAFTWLPPGAVTDVAAACATGNQEWLSQWQAADRRARSARDLFCATRTWDELVAVHTVLQHPGFALHALANSMSVRHANLHLDCTRAVLANRGVNGIDGTIASFIGALQAGDGPGLLLCGDLAFLHDLPSLALIDERDRGAIVVINNQGGAIFDLLPVAQLSGYERLVRASGQQDFAAIAQQFGLSYHACRSLEDLGDALQHATSSPLCLVECQLAADSLAPGFAQLQAAMRAG